MTIPRHKGLQNCRLSIARAAGLLSVSPRTVAHARVVQEHGSPELIAAVEQGEIRVSRAATIAKTVPKERQLDEARKPRKKAAATTTPGHTDRIKALQQIIDELDADEIEAVDQMLQAKKLARSQG
jgi:hypothetical protein